MSSPRTHEVTTDDGVTIGGRVYGHGPPLVFVHGSQGDGDLDWRTLLPYMRREFTCHLLSRRGRGTSGDHPDHRPGRVVDDVVTYVDSIRAPVGIVGWSAGAALTLAAARALSGSLVGVAVYEPPLGGVMDDEQRADRAEAVTRMRELDAEGRSTDAARAWAEFVFHDAEVAALAASGYLDTAGRYVPVLLEDVQQAMATEGFDPGDPDVLRDISSPMLVLHGPDTRPFFTAAAQHVAEHVPDARMHEIPGAGHAAPLTHPEVLADALADFFAERW
jgi:pimeloyl-ACP methyl ester carboxylesterase